MKETYDDLPALGDLRERLVEAAHREAGTAAAPARPPRRRWARRWPLIAIGGLALAGGAAGAAELLATGEPVPQSHVSAPRYGPKDLGGGRIAVSTVDPEGTGTWAVADYESKSGEQCVIAGQLRGQTLGIVGDGTFHPYAQDEKGSCADLTKLPGVTDQRYFAAADRTVVFGLVRGGARTVTLRSETQHLEGRTGPGGAFLFLLAGKVPFGEFKMSIG